MRGQSNPHAGGGGGGGGGGGLVVVYLVWSGLVWSGLVWSGLDIYPDTAALHFFLALDVIGRYCKA